MTFAPHLNQLLLFGGNTRDAQFFSTVHPFDCAKLRWLDTWQTTSGGASQSDSHLPSARSGHTAVMHREQLYIFGGQTVTITPNTTTAAASSIDADTVSPVDMQMKFFSTVHRLDTNTKQWSQCAIKGDALPALNASSSCLIGDNWYIFGGSSQEGPSQALYCINLIQLQCRKLNSHSSKLVPDARELTTLSAIQNTHLLLQGGRTITGCSDTKLWLFDIQTQQWSTLDVSPMRCAHSLIVLPQLQLLQQTNQDENQAPADVASASISAILFGGTDGQAMFSDVMLLDRPNVALQSDAVAPSKDSHVCSTCGGPKHWTQLSPGAQDVEHKSQTAPAVAAKEANADLPAQRFAHTMTLIPSQQRQSQSHNLLLFGGVNEEQDLQDTWIASLKPQAADKTHADVT